MSPANSAASPLISIDDLDSAIVSCAARINAATYEMLLLVRQFDERGGVSTTVSSGWRGGVI